MRQLKHDIAPGRGCLWNKHLLALLFSPKRQVTPSAEDATTNFFDYCNAIVQVQLPSYFYRAWVAARLVPANKADPDNLPPRNGARLSSGQHRRGREETGNEGLL